MKNTTQKTHGGKRAGAGRKPAPKRAAITVRVDTATARRFGRYCAATGLSQARAFARWVRRLPDSQIKAQPPTKNL